MLKSFFRVFSHLVFRPRQFNHKCLGKQARQIRGKRILELGSGKLYKGKHYYSVKNLFDSSNEFIQTDIREEFGHQIVDVTSMRFKNEFDVVLCLNILEHVFDFQTAIDNIYEALKDNGLAIIFVPGFYPLHDEPHDFWRFTEHSLRKILNRFSVIRLEYSGIREYPFAYYVEVLKEP